MADNLRIIKEFILTPLSAIYGAVMYVRNKMFDLGILKSESFKIPVISIGNIAVGGTGKTPHTEYIISLLAKDYKIAMLSRGYKRKTSGFVMAFPNCSPQDIGDEAYQIYQKFGDRI
ncbi:MAG TPA: tetraacyldisaccharide 4'-kinase, partial [Candidatus Limisoma gallistercoris]|nr:tetraacyldisaccharide 4'-kinase [Candidatus Limisoma gallistercoris]